MLRATNKLSAIANGVSLATRKYADLAKLSALVDVKPDVREALRAAPQSVVALESTIITHGMPYPQNLETALEVEKIVRQKGAVPATIAVIDGRIKVGMDADQLSRLARSERKDVIKSSRRDLAYVLSRHLSGGTTVAGTLAVADLVGIKVFATGGIGGVHVGGHETMDVSADLVELGRTPIAVVSSGIKSILDIPRTLEYLETQGVCVLTYDTPSLDFPAFYSRESGSKAVYNLNNATEAAELISANAALGLRSGFLIGVPLPEEFALDRKAIQNAIDQALTDAVAQDIAGREVTPFVIETLSNLTEGKTLESNKALIKHNAAIAADIAVELTRVEHAESDAAKPLKARAPVS